jgi:hypothetical protein
MTPGFVGKGEDMLAMPPPLLYGTLTKRKVGSVSAWISSRMVDEAREPYPSSPNFWREHVNDDANGREALIDDRTSLDLI